MIEVAEKLVETMNGRQVLVPVAQVVLAELPGRVSERLERLGNAHVLGVQADVCARKTDLRQPSTDRRLPGDESRATGGAALLTIPVGEHRAFVADAVDVRRAVAHDPVVVDAHVKPADIVGHDHEDVGLAPGRSRLWLGLR